MRERGIEYNKNNPVVYFHKKALNHLCWYEKQYGVSGVDEFVSMWYGTHPFSYLEDIELTDIPLKNDIGCPLRISIETLQKLKEIVEEKKLKNIGDAIVWMTFNDQWRCQPCLSFKNKFPNLSFEDTFNEMFRNRSSVLAYERTPKKKKKKEQILTSKRRKMEISASSQLLDSKKKKKKEQNQIQNRRKTELIASPTLFDSHDMSQVLKSRNYVEGSCSTVEEIIPSDVPLFFSVPLEQLYYRQALHDLGRVSFQSIPFILELFAGKDKFMKTSISVRSLQRQYAFISSLETLMMKKKLIETRSKFHLQVDCTSFKGSEKLQICISYWSKSNEKPLQKVISCESIPSKSSQTQKQKIVAVLEDYRLLQHGSECRLTTMTSDSAADITGVRCGLMKILREYLKRKFLRVPCDLHALHNQI